jgi:hypothetical protein
VGVEVIVRQGLQDSRKIATEKLKIPANNFMKRKNKFKCISFNALPIRLLSLEIRLKKLSLPTLKKYRSQSSPQEKEKE